MAFIFINSAMEGTSSSGVSEAVVGVLFSISKWFGNGIFINRVRDIIQSEGFHLYIRKTAHFLEFGILGMLVTASIGIFPKIRFLYFRRFIISSGFCIIYSISDEIHQFFVDGRVCAVTDMIIDSLGAIAFSIAMVCIIRNVSSKDADDSPGI